MTLLRLNREPKEFIGLNIEAGVMDPSLELSPEVMVEVMVPVREDAIELVFNRVSARSKTFPLNMELYEALCGVEGTVA